MRDWSWSDLPRLGRFLKRCAPDAILLIYIGWIYNYHPMITFAPTVAKALLPGVPFVTQFENASGALPERMSPLARVIRKGVAGWAGRRNVDYYFGTLLRDSDRIIVLSDLHRAQLSEFLAGVNEKSVLIPPPPILYVAPEDNGAARRRGRERLGVKSEEFLIVYLGYIYPGKGIETLLHAFHMVTCRRGDVRLVLVGGVISMEDPEHPFYAQEVQELPRQLGIEDRVTWTGEYAWDSEEASVYLRAADACVLPFDRGVYLNNSSFAAAAAHGLPIITTQGKKSEPVFIHQGNVWLCPPKNPEEMAGAIETLMKDPALRARLGAGARALARDWFSWEKAIERTIATFS
jgi:glycosyltransferase involved in cell wall biosynthesis